jgi:hypothetical protein
MWQRTASECVSFIILNNLNQHEETILKIIMGFIITAFSSSRIHRTMRERMEMFSEQCFGEDIFQLKKKSKWNCKICKNVKKN